MNVLKTPMIKLSVNMDEAEKMEDCDGGGSGGEEAPLDCSSSTNGSTSPPAARIVTTKAIVKVKKPAYLFIYF